MTLYWAHDNLRLIKISPSLLPLLRSQMQGELLAPVVLHPEREFTLTELADSLGASHTAVLREVDRLVGGGHPSRPPGRAESARYNGEPGPPPADVDVLMV